jgi:hypothetical protein
MASPLAFARPNAVMKKTTEIFYVHILREIQTALN